MGTARIEIIRKANRNTLNPGEIDRRAPNPLEIISLATTTSAALSDPVSDQVGFQDLYARVTVSEAGRVGVGDESTDSSGGYQLAASNSIDLPVRSGDVIEVIDLA